MSESICYGRLLAAHDYDILAAQDNATMQELTHAINQLTLANLLATFERSVAAAMLRRTSDAHAANALLAEN